jgi:uroporphyrinogen decarboxylase
MTLGLFNKLNFDSILQSTKGNEKIMTGRERIITTINHEEPDRVPIAPRLHAWFKSEYGVDDLETNLRELPDVDFMYIDYDCQPNYLDSFPDIYDLPKVKVEQKKYNQDDMLIVERIFHTPAGNLMDRTKIPPSGREYGVFPDPIRTEHLIKNQDDLDALYYILPEVKTNFDFYNQHKKLLGHRGVAMVLVRSALDHNAGYARDMQDLMVDYYDNRNFFNNILDIFHQRSLTQIKAAMEGGVEFIFGSWYFCSLSSGWSPGIFREVFLPLIKDHVNLTHEYNAYYDFYDDGNLNGSMEMIASAGVDILETCTPPPVGDFDLTLAKEKIGAKTTIKGYIDLLYVVKFGDTDLIDKTVKEVMEVAKPGGGFIIGSSDSFREGTPKENIEAYFNACKKYGKY